MDSTQASISADVTAPATPRLAFDRAADAQHAARISAEIAGAQELPPRLRARAMNELRAWLPALAPNTGQGAPGEYTADILINAMLAAEQAALSEHADAASATELFDALVRASRLDDAVARLLPDEDDETLLRIAATGPAPLLALVEHAQGRATLRLARFAERLLAELDTEALVQLAPRLTKPGPIAQGLLRTRLDAASESETATVLAALRTAPDPDVRALAYEWSFSDTDPVRRASLTAAALTDMNAGVRAVALAAAALEADDHTIDVLASFARDLTAVEPSVEEIDAVADLLADRTNRHSADALDAILRTLLADPVRRVDGSVEHVICQKIRQHRSVRSAWLMFRWVVAPGLLHRRGRGTQPDVFGEPN